MNRLIALGLVLLASGAFAQSPPPPKLEPLPTPPPSTSAPLDEPRVRIPVREGDVVEETRVNGRVVRMKVTPKDGPPYYLVDTSGNGTWARRETLDDGVHVPMWPLFTFD